MLIPTTSAKIAWWHRMLVGNKKKGVQFLSNVMYIQPWALEAIDDGGLVTVVYDPKTPNRTELIQIIEAAGFADRASAVIAMIQIGLSGSSDWATIAGNAQTMEIIFGNANARQLVFTLPVAFNAIVNSEVGRNALLSNSMAWSEMLGYSNLVDIALQTPAFITSLAGHTSGTNIMIGHLAFDRIVTISNNIIPILNNPTLYAAILASSVARTKVFSANVAMTHITNISDLWNAVLSDNASRASLYNITSAIEICIINSDIRDAILANTTYAHEFIDNFYSVQGMMNLARSEGSAGALMLGKIYENVSYRGRFMASSYFASLTFDSGSTLTDNMAVIQMFPNNHRLATNRRFLLMGMSISAIVGVGVTSYSMTLVLNTGNSLNVAGSGGVFNTVHSPKIGVWSPGGITGSATGTNSAAGDFHTSGNAAVYGFYFS